MRPHFLLVGNSSAQSGRNRDRIHRARVLLDEAGLAHEFLETLPSGATVKAVRDQLLANPALDTVIAMGGDGTFAEVAKGLLLSPRDVRLAMLPTGTANDQGKSFGLEASPEALARNVEIIREGHETRLDVGSIVALDGSDRVLREDHFFDSAGWGISPRALAQRNEDWREIERIAVLRDVFRDHAVYASAFLKTFLASYVQDQKFDAIVRADGQTVRWDGLTDLVVKATRVYGGLWVFDPTSRHDDGLFEIVPFIGKRDWSSKALVSLDKTGALAESLSELGVRQSQHLRGAHIELDLLEHEGGEPIFAQIDGEEFPGSPKVRIEVEKQALRLVVPDRFATEDVLT